MWIPQKTCLVHNNEKLKFIICINVYCKTEETILEKYEQLDFVDIPQHITIFYEERRSSTEHSINIKHMYKTTARKIPKSAQNKNVALCAVQVAWIRGSDDWHRWDHNINQMYYFDLYAYHGHVLCPRDLPKDDQPYFYLLFSQKAANTSIIKEKQNQMKLKTRSIITFLFWF